MPNFDTLGSYLASLRRMRNLTQPQVAERVGVSVRTLVLREQDTYTPRTDELAAWLDAVQATDEERARVAQMVTGRVA